MEIIHMQRIGGGVTRTLMDGIVQNELSIGADLGIKSSANKRRKNIRFQMRPALSPDVPVCPPTDYFTAL